MSCVCTIGFFDGVHLGHQHLISQLVQIGKERNLPAHVITFSQHPRTVCRQTNVRLLTSTEEKMALLQRMGIEKCHILSFSPEMARLSAREFMERYLKNTYHATALLVGYNHHFGHPAPGENFEHYLRYGREMGVDVIEATPFNINADNVSSSLIRTALERRDIRRANRLLGRPYSLSATVVHGRSVGRTLGFPTANLHPTNPIRLIPPSGCYAVCATIQEKGYAGMLYVGVRPTFSDQVNPIPSIEVNLFNFHDDLYGKTMTVEFHDLLRGEKKFESQDELRRQLEEDRLRTIHILKQVTTT